MDDGDAACFLCLGPAELPYKPLGACVNPRCPIKAHRACLEDAPGAAVPCGCTMALWRASALPRPPAPPEPSHRARFYFGGQTVGGAYLPNACLTSPACIVGLFLLLVALGLACPRLPRVRPVPPDRARLIKDEPVVLAPGHWHFHYDPEQEQPWHFSTDPPRLLRVLDLKRPGTYGPVASAMSHEPESRRAPEPGKPDTVSSQFFYRGAWDMLESYEPRDVVTTWDRGIGAMPWVAVAPPPIGWHPARAPKYWHVMAQRWPTGRTHPEPQQPHLACNKSHVG